jgi:hypothetical protein
VAPVALERRDFGRCDNPFYFGRRHPDALFVDSQESLAAATDALTAAGSDGTRPGTILPISALWLTNSRDTGVEYGWAIVGGVIGHDAPLPLPWRLDAADHVAHGTRGTPSDQTGSMKRSGRPRARNN